MEHSNQEKDPNAGGSWVLNGNAAKLGDVATKGGVGAVLAIVFMFAQDFKDDQRTILDKLSALEIKFVQNEADKSALSTRIDSLTADLRTLAHETDGQSRSSRRNLEALKALAREMSILTNKTIEIPPLGDY